jgi:hypothetical protein
MPFITFTTHPIPHHSLILISSVTITSSASGFPSGEEADCHAVKSIPTEADQPDNSLSFCEINFV